MAPSPTELLEEARKALAAGRQGEAVRDAKEAVELCRKANDKKALAEALHAAAGIFLAKGADSTAVAVEAVEAAAEPDPREALRHAYEALTLFKDLGQRDGEASVLNEIAEARLMLGYGTEAANAAQQALSIFRGSGNKKGRQASLDTIIRAYNYAMQAPKSLEVAKEELYLSRDAGDKASELAALRKVVEIYTLLGRPGEALSAATEASALAKEVKDGEAAELLAVAELQRGSGRLDRAQKAAEEAAAVARNTGDKASEEQAKWFLSEMQVEKGKAEAAPNRTEALEAIGNLASAVEERNAEAFKRAMERLNDVSGFTEEDVQKAIAPILERDRSGAATFLRMVGFDASDADPTLFKEYPKKLLYLNFRMGGLNYGPRFRLCSPCNIKKPGSGTDEACSVLQVWEDQEDWGKALCFHPGLMDSMQHTGNAIGI